MKITVIKPVSRPKERIRACAYCRVSTEHEEQENSLENQISHYKEVFSSDTKYDFVDVYYDFGISGFKEDRPGFQQMMSDARAGKFDLIITKSVTRFARNTVTVLKAIRELKELGVGIFFELQNINTLTEAGELMITILSAFAQGESESARETAQMIYRRKYEAGIPVQYLDRCFGYMKDENGFFVPDPEEAKWIVDIFRLASDGYDYTAIARYLNGKGIKTKNGRAFSKSTIKRILENEIYKGDYEMRKNYVNDERKEVANMGREDSWYIEDDHPPIVSRKLWDRVQDVIHRKRTWESEAKELTEDNYPYHNHIFCAECGHRLLRNISANRKRISWSCGGRRRYGVNFCKGITVPDYVLQDWGELPGNIYIRAEIDDLGKKKFKYVRESTWKRDHKKKKRQKPLPELNTDNYPFLGKIFCAKCGSYLTRCVCREITIWVCSRSKYKGQSACTGIWIPDREIRKQNITDDTYIERKDKENGEKCYVYTSAPHNN